MHVMVKSMNFGVGGGAESLHYYALKQNFPYKKKGLGVRGRGAVTVKKITSSKTCHAWSVKINQLKISLFVIHV